MASNTGPDGRDARPYLPTVGAALRRDESRCGTNHRGIKPLLRFGFWFAVVGFALLSACAKKEPSPSTSTAPRQILRLSQRNEPGDLDPATLSIVDETFILRALSEGLVSPAPQGGQRPAAAERWDIAADGLTYTFHLRANARWSNGEPVTAPDFVESYHRALTPATAGPKVSVFFPVKNARAFLTGAVTDFSAVGFRAPDTSTLVVTLEQPNPAFLAYVASGPWIPTNPRTVAHFGRNWTRPGNYVGNGPFVLTEWSPHQRIVVKKNPQYVGAAAVKLDEIDFLAFDNGEAEERAYRTGQVDVTMAVPVSKIPVYARESPGEFHQTPLAETRYLAFNTQHPPLNDPRVRRALSLVIDRERITAKVVLSGEPTTEFVPPSLKGWPSTSGRRPSDPAQPNPPGGRVPPSDLDEARALLAAAGFPEGRGFPRLEMSCWSPSQNPTLEAIQARWKTTLGIEVGLALREAKVHFAALRTGSYDIGYVTAIPDAADPLVLFSYLTTNAGDNYAHWSNPAYDALIARATRAANLADQAPLLAEAEALLKTEAPVAPLYFNVKNWLKSPRVQGWQEDALWTRFYTEIYLDETPPATPSHPRHDRAP